MNDTFMKEKPIFPLLTSMALPMVVSMLVNALYNIVDSLFVARISEEAMTALSLVYPVQNLINAIAIGFSIGIAALISLHLGAGNKEKADMAATHGMVLSLILGLLMGMAMAKGKGKCPDALGTGYVVIVRAVPSLIYLFLLQIAVTGLFHIPMMFSERNPVTWILPTVSLSLSSIAWYAIWLRRFMVDEENRDYVKFARSKGMTDWKLMKRHVLRNALVPLAQYFPLQMLLTISGSLVIESLYSIPGMGGLLVEAIQEMDNSLVQVLVILYSALGVLGVFLGDILMVLLDPRIRLTDKKEG